MSALTMCKLRAKNISSNIERHIYTLVCWFVAREKKACSRRYVHHSVCYNKFDEGGMDFRPNVWRLAVSLLTLRLKCFVWRSAYIITCNNSSSLIGQRIVVFVRVFIITYLDGMVKNGIPRPIQCLILGSNVVPSKYTTSYLVEYCRFDTFDLIRHLV